MLHRANGKQIEPDGSQDEGALSEVGDPEDVKCVFFPGRETRFCLQRKGEKNV